MKSLSGLKKNEITIFAGRCVTVHGTCIKETEIQKECSILSLLSRSYIMNAEVRSSSGRDGRA